MKLYRVLVSAGDPSGDLILAKVIESLKKQAPSRGLSLEFVGLAGPASIAEGVRSVAESKDVAVVGIVEVLKNLPRLFAVLGVLSQEARKCQSVLTVDFPDFNLKLASLVKKFHKPVDHIIAPQVWAWRKNRVFQIVKLFRSLFPALGFEEGLFAPHGLKTFYRGHPLRDILPPRNRRLARETFGLSLDAPTLVWMPGSRKNEIQKHLPIFLKTWKLIECNGDRLVGEFKGIDRWKILLPLAPGWAEKEFFEAAGLDSEMRVYIEKLQAKGSLILAPAGKSRECLMAGDFGWIASGTATLEAAFYQLPHILVYKLSGLSALLIRALSDYFHPVRRGFVGLPNILLERGVIPELLQSDLNPQRLCLESLELLGNTPELVNMRKSLRYIPKRMGDPGVCDRIASDLLDLWTSQS